MSSASDERCGPSARSLRSRTAATVATVGLAIGLGLLRHVLAGSNADPVQPPKTGNPAAHEGPSTPATGELLRLQDFLIRDRKPRIFLLILMQLGLWLQLFSYARSPRFGEALIIPSCIGIVIAIFGLIQGKARFGVFETILNVETTFSMLTALFSILYWSYGSRPNFSSNLTRLDAIYFTVGTLTTAGTGSLSAESEIARGIQVLQMVLDLTLVVFAVAVVLTSLTSRQANQRKSAESATGKKFI